MRIKLKNSSLIQAVVVPVIGAAIAAAGTVLAYNPEVFRWLVGREMTIQDNEMLMQRLREGFQGQALALACYFVGLGLAAGFAWVLLAWLAPLNGPGETKKLRRYWYIALTATLALGGVLLYALVLSGGLLAGYSPPGQVLICLVYVLISLVAFQGLALAAVPRKADWTVPGRLALVRPFGRGARS